MTLQAEYPCYFKKTGTAQTAATGDSRPPKARNGGCPNRYGTAVVPTATERRLSQPLPMRGCRFKRPITPPTPTPLAHSASAGNHKGVETIAPVQFTLEIEDPDPWAQDKEPIFWTD